MDIVASSSADHEVAKRPGNGTTSRAFAYGGEVVLDHKLLVPEIARIDHVGHLKWRHGGRVKDTRDAGDGRVIRPTVGDPTDSPAG